MGNYIDDHVKLCKKYLPEADLLFVNDFSSDNTSDKIAANSIATINLEKHSGKAAALRAGFNYALEKNYAAVITIDSDMQHAHSTLPSFIKAFSAGANLVLGRRSFRPESMPRMRILSNSLSSGLVSKLVGFKVTDSQCGFRLVSREYLETTSTSNGFQFETEFLVHAIWQGAKALEVDIPTIYNQSKSSMKYVNDTVKFSLLFFQLFKEKALGHYANKK